MNQAHFDTGDLSQLPQGDSGAQHLYAIGFEGGITKFGRTSNPKQRLCTHQRMSGGAILWHYVTPALHDGPSYEAERRVLRLAGEVGMRAGRQEVFSGIERRATLGIVAKALRPEWFKPSKGAKQP